MNLGKGLSKIDDVQREQKTKQQQQQKKQLNINISRKHSKWLCVRVPLLSLKVHI